MSGLVESNAFPLVSVKVGLCSNCKTVESLKSQALVPKCLDLNSRPAICSAPYLTSLCLSLPDNEMVLLTLPIWQSGCWGQVLRTGPGPWKAFYVSSYYHIMPCIPFIIFYLLIYLFFLLFFHIVSSEPLRPFHFLLVPPYGILVPTLEKHRLSKQLVKEISAREKSVPLPLGLQKSRNHTVV